MGKPRPYERLIAEWSTAKVRIRHGDLWWRWDSGGYTYDMASAGLYDASFKTWRSEDKVVPVDPSAFEIDALMQRLADAERDLELLAKVRNSIHRNVLVATLTVDRDEWLSWDKTAAEEHDGEAIERAEALTDLIALLSPGDAGRGGGGERGAT